MKKEIIRDLWFETIKENEDGLRSAWIYSTDENDSVRFKLLIDEFYPDVITDKELYKRLEKTDLDWFYKIKRRIENEEQSDHSEMH